MANVGRYKINKKLHIKNRLFNQRLAESLIDIDTGEIIAEAGQTVDRRLLDEIMPYLEKSVGFKNYHVTGGVMDSEDIPLQTIDVFSPIEDAKVVKVIANANIDKSVKHITQADIISSISYFINLLHGIGNTDDIDHLGNRRLRSVGELLQNQFRIGLSRMERVVRERMSIQDANVITPQALINIRPVIASIKEFFGSSQLSQFMDQTNPLAELTHKRRLSALGPGGLTRERAGFEVRDVHHSHYGRMCPIETPEGPNIGLINSLSTFARINEYGFIEAPYRWVDPKTGKVTDQIDYLTADEEDNYIVAQANAELNEDGTFADEMVIVRYNKQSDNILPMPSDRVDYMDVSPKQVVSVATALIPFLENDDSNRALMGSNMQRQAVPLLIPKAPLVGTGMEHKSAKDSGVCIVSKHDGIIERSSANEIWVRRVENVDGQEVKGDLIKHKLHKFMRSNQGTCINQRPIVKRGDVIKKVTFSQTVHPRRWVNWHWAATSLLRS